MSEKELKCPYCGSYNASKTGFGWAESVTKGISAFGVGLVVSSFSHPHGHMATHNMIEANSSEYKCQSCRRTFRYSEKKGSYK